MSASTRGRSIWRVNAFTDRPFAGNLPQKFFGLGHFLACGNHVIDQAKFKGLSGVNHVGGHEQLQGFCFANVLHQPLRSAVTGNDAQVDFRLAKTCVLTCYAQVASHGQFTTTTQRKTIDGGYDGFVKALNGKKYLMAPGSHLPAFFGVELQKLLDVGTGYEGFLPGSSDDDPPEAFHAGPILGEEAL